MADSIVIVGAARTPMGAFQGDFSALAAHDLGGAAIKAAVQRAAVPADAVGEVLFGNCLMAGQGQAPARQAAFKGGLPRSAGAVTLSKMCGSGMKAAMLAHDLIKAGSAKVVVAGGMESMTNAPHLLNGSRTGIRYGSAEFLDHMAYDGLTNPYDGQAMGVFGDMACAKYQYDRAALRRLRALGYRHVHTSDRRHASPQAWLQPRFSVVASDTPETIRDEVLAPQPMPRRIERTAVGLAKRLR